MKENNIALGPWEEVLGTCKNISKTGTEITITLQTFNKIVNLRFITDQPIDGIQGLVEKQVSILRTDETYLLHEIITKNEFGKREFSKNSISI